MTNTTQIIESPTVSIQRYALAIGWGKYLANTRDIMREVDALKKLRGTNFGIAVGNDKYALEYQRIDFRLHRALYAVGSMGLIGHASFQDDGTWKHASASEVKAMNGKWLDRYRQRAHKAKKSLQAAGMLHCDECGDYGYHTIGDESYPCECRAQGIIAVA